MNYMIVVVVTMVISVIGTLVAEYLVIRNNTAYLLRKYAETLVKAKNLKSSIADVENLVNGVISNLK